MLLGVRRASLPHCLCFHSQGEIPSSLLPSCSLLDPSSSLPPSFAFSDSVFFQAFLSSILSPFLPGCPTPDTPLLALIPSHSSFCLWGDTMLCSRSSCGSDSLYSDHPLDREGVDAPAMGDYPRWVDREDVDSAAMYSAFMSYEHHMKTNEDMNTGAYHPVWWGHLHMIMHRVEVPLDFLNSATRLNNLHVRPIECTKVGCKRCEAGRGGYQFRWYSRYWAKSYNMARRPGAWAAPEPAEQHESSGLRFWERREGADVSE